MNKKIRNRILLALVVAGAVVFQNVNIPDTQSPIFTENNQKLDRSVQKKSTPKKKESSDVQRAFQNKRSDVQVRGVGKVVKVLRDDTVGSKHQKFILNINSNISILIAHNIDLAPRIQNIREGDSVEFFGEYEYNQKGGVVHWTHKDPRNRHIGGWLKHKNNKYE